MKKFTLLIASLFFTIGAMAQGTTYDFSYPSGNVTHDTHYPRSVSITDSDGLAQTVNNIATATGCPAYFDKTENIFYVYCGETVTPKIVINGNWMHGYAYVDWNDDKQFTVNLTGSGPYSSGEGNELVSYTYYGASTGEAGDGWNSAGESAGGNQAPELDEFGSFTVPDGLEVGTQLRMRFTVMWNCIVPTGASYANFFSDGASIIDVTLEIVAPATAEEKAELSKYIGKAGDVLDRFADKSKVKGDKIDIVGKISSNAGQNENNTNGDDDGAGIAGLTDNNVNTYFHSRWGGTYVNEDHYLQIDLGEGQTLSDFCFAYSVRKGNNTNETSPAPTKIEVRVSEDGADFGEPIVTLTKNANNLPSYTDLGNTLWCSDVIEANKNVRYIRLTVTEVEGPGNIAWDGTSAYSASNRNGRGHVFFGLSALNLYSANLPDIPNAVKGEYAEKYTVEQVNAINESLAAANLIDLTVNHKKEFVNSAVSELKEALSPFYHLLKVSAAGYATLCLGFDAEIPGLGDGENGAYIATGMVAPGYIHLEPIEGVIPAEAGVIIKAAEGEYDFMASNGTTANVEDNLLRGSVSDEYVEGAAYVLSAPDGAESVGLYPAKLNKNATGGEGTTHFLNNANKAYLPKTDGLNAASYSFRFGEGTTGIDEITDNREQSTVIYDLTGRRIDAITAPGIYIVNGVKKLVR